MDSITNRSQQESNSYLQRHLKYTNTTQDKQLMMFFSYSIFIRNQAKKHNNTEAVNCGTAFPQK